MVEVIGCMKDCCKEERNLLFSICLVNGMKKDKIKSQQEKFGLDTKGNILVVRLEDAAWGFPITGGGGQGQVRPNFATDVVGATGLAVGQGMELGHLCHTSLSVTI